MITICKRLDLIGGKVIAIGGTKLRAQNSTSVDDKHYLPIDFKTTNNNDTHDMGNMTARAKSIIGHNDFTTLLDKGYHTGSEISRCHEMGVETMVAIPALSTQAVDPAYNVDQFIYHKETDTY